MDSQTNPTFSNKKELCVQLNNSNKSYKNDSIVVNDNNDKDFQIRYLIDLVKEAKEEIKSIQRSIAHLRHDFSNYINNSNNKVGGDSHV